DAGNFELSVAVSMHTRDPRLGSIPRKQFHFRLWNRPLSLLVPEYNPACDLAFPHIAPTIFEGRHEHDTQPVSAFLRGIYHYDRRPKWHETVYVRIELIAAGLQFTKDECAITGGLHGGEILSVL